MCAAEAQMLECFPSGLLSVYYHTTTSEFTLLQFSLLWFLGNTSFPYVAFFRFLHVLILVFIIQ